MSQEPVTVDPMWLREVLEARGDIEAKLKDWIDLCPFDLTD